MLAYTQFKSTSDSYHNSCHCYLLLSTSMVNLASLLPRSPNVYGVEHISCISNTWILLILKLSLIRMS